jgi:hypothetical protein
MMTVKAASETTVEVEPNATTAQVGQSFTVNVTLTNVENLYGVQVTLYWNASILKAVNADVRLGVESHSDGVLHQVTGSPVDIVENEINQAEGEYTLVGVSESPAPSFNGSGNIVRITFNVISAGSCSLDLAAELSSRPPLGSVSQSIAHATIDGFFSFPFIGISASPGNATLGENINISGYIVPAQANVPVGILYRINGEANWSTLATVATDEQGNYQHMWQPKENGEYEINATATIEGENETSTSVFVNVKAPEQPAWLYIAIIIVIVAIIIVVVAIVIYRKRPKLKKHK